MIIFILMKTHDNIQTNDSILPVMSAYECCIVRDVKLDLCSVVDEG